MVNSVIEFLGGFTRYFFSILRGKSKPLSSFYNPFSTKISLEDMLENDAKNRKVGFVILIIFILLIYTGAFN